MSDVLKIPPHSNDAEAALLGAILKSDSCMDAVSDLITVNDLYKPSSREIYKTIEQLRSEQIAVDSFTVSDRLAEQGSDIGLADVAYLEANCPSVANVRSYAGIIKARSAQRAVIQLGMTIADLGWQDGLKAGERIDKAQSLANTLTAQDLNEGAQINDALRELLDVIEHRSNHPGELDGISTGFERLDQRYYGLGPDQLFVIAARPSMGKTTLGMNIAESVFSEQGKNVLFFSMEMGRRELVARLLSSQGDLSATALKTGKLTEDDWPKLSRAVTKLKDKGLYIDDTPALHINQIRSRARHKSRQMGIDLIVVDYIQLATADGHSREERIGEVSRGLKGLAKELHVPVIALAQLNRDCDKRNDKRPLLSDLRDSGSVEQDADVVSFIYRDEVYNPESDHKGVAEIITRKWRNGETGTDYLMSQLQFCRFRNMAGVVEPIQTASGFTY